MSVFQRAHMQSLDGATGWVKSDPLGPAELRGHVVLLNFWTLRWGPPGRCLGNSRSAKAMRKRRTSHSGCP
jgi:hypothetical protein